MRLVIGGPARDSGPASFAIDLARCYAHTREHGPWGTAVDLGYVLATYVHVGREAAVELALRAQATHLLWIDTDMTFPPDTALRLYAHHRPIVAANSVRRVDGVCTATRNGQIVITDHTSTGLEAVDAVGFGVVLMNLDVLDRLPPRPWFTHGHGPRGDIGEDVMLCRALRAAGVPIVIDHDVSKEIGHVGQYVYRPRLDAVAVHG